MNSNEQLIESINKLREDIINHPYYLDYININNKINESIDIKIIKSDIEELVELKNKYEKLNNMQEEIIHIENKINKRKHDLYTLDIVIEYREKRKKLLSLLDRINKEVLTKLDDI